MSIDVIPNDEVLQKIQDHVCNGYSLWDRFRRWLCKDLIERETGFVLIAVRRSMGKAIQSNPTNTALKHMTNWISETFAVWFTNTWKYLESKGISWRK